MNRGRARTIAGLFLAAMLFSASDTAVAGSGQLREWTIQSRVLRAPRVIHLYLPPSYASQPDRRFPVLYLHDGQNMFSSAGTNAAFGWGSWELDKTVDELSGAGQMQEIIMVAVNNSTARLGEYSGARGAPEAPTAFDKYRAFLLSELKPAIDRDFRTRTEAAHTAVMGSSLGGLASLALAWDDPEVFGLAASLSGAFQVDHTNFLNVTLAGYSGAPRPIRIYLDSGIRDFTGGDDGRALTARVAAELRRIGWTRELDFFVDDRDLTPAEFEANGLRRDKWAEARTSQHNEFYWRLRSKRALGFLFPPREGE